MNKIFKVIWSKSKECYVVVSEIANNYSAKKAVLTSVFAVLAVTGSAAHVMGATLPSELTDKGSIKIGQYATTSNMSSIVIGTSSQFRTSSVDGYRAIGIGSGIIASGNNSVSIGGHSRATEDQAIAIGGASDDSGAKATGSQSIAIGGNTVASGDSSIVVGGDDVEVAFARTVTYTDINTGQAKTGTLRQASIDLANIQLPQYITATASHAGTAIGMKTKAGDLGLSLGMGADSATRLDGKAGNVVNAIAIGAGAKANRDNSIAIGGGANTDAAGVAQTSYTLSNGDTVNWAGGENVLPGDVVSFGAPGYERQLKNVAPGIVSATSTDAVNGSQLYAIAEKTLSKYISIKSDLAGNKSNKGAEATDSMAIGPDASTTTAATKGTALGTGATVTVANGVAVGSQSKASTASGVAGYNVNDSRTDKYGSLSGKALTSTLGAFAVGNETNTRQITGVAAGTADTDAVNVAQLKSVNLKVAGDTGTGDVNLANSTLNIKGAGLAKTTASGKDVTVTVSEKAVKQEAVKAVTMAAADPNGPITVTPELSADKDTATYKVGIDPTKVAETTNLTYKDNDGADKTVTLKKGLNFKNGTMTAATTGADGVVTVDINDDTKTKINNAATNKLDNLTPDGEQKVKSLSAWKVKANNNNAETVTGGDTVTFNDGSNIAITQNGKTFTVATKDDVTFNSVTAGSKVTAPAVEGLTNTSWTPGTTTPVSGRAATEDQLKAVDTQVATNKDDIATNKANIDKNKDNIAKNADNITKNATEIATNKGNIATNTQNIATNTAALARKISLGGDTGNTTEKSLSTGDVKFNVKGAGLVTTSAAGDDVTVTVTEKAVKQEAVKAVTMAAADPNGPITVTPELSADKDTATYKIGIDPTKIAESTILTYKDNDGTDKTVTLKKGLNFKNGTMTTATTAADGVVTVDINDDTKAKINNAATNKLDNLTPEGEQKVKTLATWNVATAADGGTHSGDSTSTVTGSDTVTFKAGNNLNVNQTGRDIIFSLNKEISDMTSLGLTNPDGAKATIKTGKGDAHVGETDQADRIVYTNAAGTEEQVATLKDGLQFGGDNNPEVINKTLNQKLEVVGGADAAKLSDNNIGVNAKDGKLHVQLSKELNNLTSAQFKNGNAVSTISSAGTTVTDGTNTTQYGPKGITINPGANEISLTDKGLNNGGKVISNVASGGNVDTNAANIGDVKKATAASKTTVSVNKKDTETPNLVLEATVDPADGHTNYDIKLANKVNLGNGNIVLDGTDGSIKAKGNITSEGTVEGKDLKAGDVTVNKDNKGTVNGLSNKTWTRGQAPVSGQAATEDQIQAVDTRVMAVEDKVADFGWMAKSSATGTGQATGNNAATKVGDKTEVEFRAGDNLTIDQTGTTFTYSLNKNMTGLESVSVGDVANDKPGVVLNGADGTMGVRGKDGANASITAAKGADGLTGTGAGKDRIVYETKDAAGNPVKETVATMNDGLHFAGDNGNTVIDKTLNQKLEIVGGADAAKLTDNNIGVNAKDGKLQVQLAKDLNGLSSVEVKDDNGASAVMKGDTIKSKDAAGNTSVVNGSGVTITPANPQNPNAGTVSLTTEGLNNGNNQIKGVAAGTADTDAVNLGQLKKSNAQLANAIANVESETQRVGAHAAAMSALKPIQYDPLEPTQVMAGYGNYRGKSAAALGLAHYTNEDTMFNVGVSVGGRHNMINAGYTHKFGNSDAKQAVPERYKGGPISSIYVMQDEMTSLKQENSRQKEVLDKQQAEIESLKAMVNSLLATKG